MRTCCPFSASRLPTQRTSGWHAGSPKICRAAASRLVEFAGSTPWADPMTLRCNELHRTSLDVLGHAKICRPVVACACVAARRRSALSSRSPRDGHRDGYAKFAASRPPPARESVVGSMTSNGIRMNSPLSEHLQYSMTRRCSAEQVRSRSGWLHRGRPAAPGRVRVGLPPHAAAIEDRATTRVGQCADSPMRWARTRRAAVAHSKQRRET